MRCRRSISSCRLSCRKTSIQRIYDRYQMEVMLNNTTKPIVFVTPDFEGCVTAVEMCEAVAGGAEAFQRKPFATCYINITAA